MSDVRQDSAGILAPPPVLYLGALGGGVLLHVLFPLHILPAGFTLWLAGIALFAAGAFLARWSFNTMRKAGTSADPSSASKALVTNGPFRLSRNPIYVAMTLLYLGVALMVDSWWPVMLLAPLLALMQWGIILREERYLENVFGTTYVEYKSSTRRWI